MTESKWAVIETHYCSAGKQPYPLLFETLDQAKKYAHLRAREIVVNHARQFRSHTVWEENQIHELDAMIADGRNFIEFENYNMALEVISLPILGDC
jgi:hypothetical protein